MSDESAYRVQLPEGATDDLAKIIAYLTTKKGSAVYSLLLTGHAACEPFSLNASSASTPQRPGIFNAGTWYQLVSSR